MTICDSNINNMKTLNKFNNKTEQKTSKKEKYMICLGYIAAFWNYN